MSRVCGFCGGGGILTDPAEGIDPGTPVDQLSDEQRQRFYIAAASGVLRTSLERLATAAGVSLVWAEEDKVGGPGTPKYNDRLVSDIEDRLAVLQAGLDDESDLVGYDTEMLQRVDRAALIELVHLLRRDVHDSEWQLETCTLAATRAAIEERLADCFACKDYPPEAPRCLACSRLQEVLVVLAANDDAADRPGDFKTKSERLAEALRSIEEYDQLLTRLSGLLRGTANALKGEPPELVTHDWSDLPVVAAETVRQRDQWKERCEDAQVEARLAGRLLARECPVCERTDCKDESHEPPSIPDAPTVHARDAAVSMVDDWNAEDILATPYQFVDELFVRLRTEGWAVLSSHEVTAMAWEGHREELKARRYKALVEGEVLDKVAGRLAEGLPGEAKDTLLTAARAQAESEAREALQDRPVPGRTNKARCKLCGDVIESRHRWDMVWCSCKAISVDGGHDYTKRAWDGRRGSLDELMEDLSEGWPEPAQGGEA